jgi:probable phosphoglycerate mutase
VLAARWLGLEPAAGRYFLLGTASLSVLGYEHNLTEPVIRLWNETRHIQGVSEQ